MYLKFFLPSSVVNLWFNLLYAFMFYSLICATFLYERNNIYLNSITKILFYSTIVGINAAIFTYLNRYINSQLASLSQNFFTVERLIAKTIFYIIPLLLALISSCLFDNNIFKFGIINNPLIYLIWVIPYEVFEYLRLEYQKTDEI